MTRTDHHSSFKGGFLGDIEGLLDSDDAAIRDDDLDLGLVLLVCCQVLDFTNDIHTGEDLAKDNMAAVQPLGLYCGDEELGTVGVLAWK